MVLKKVTKEELFTVFLQYMQAGINWTVYCETGLSVGNVTAVNHVFIEKTK